MERPRRSGRHSRVRETAERRYQAPQAAEGVGGVLLDSDVIIDILRGDSARQAALREFERAGGKAYCCAVSWAEIFAGIRPGEEILTESFLAARGEVMIDTTTGRRAGSYLARYARTHRLGIADALIAATAVSAGLRLWTRNRRDYPMPDLSFFQS